MFKSPLFTSIVLIACCVTLGRAQSKQTPVAGNKNSGDKTQLTETIPSNRQPSKTSSADVQASSRQQSVSPAEELKQLKTKLAEQQHQIEQLRSALKEQQKLVGNILKAQNTSAEASASADASAEVKAPQEPKLGEVASLAGMVPSPPAQAMTAPARRRLPRLSDLAYGKVKIGATFYALYRYFPQTGFGPQTLDNTDIHPGPGNDGYNEFNVNRGYINIFYMPTDALTFRVTPNFFRQVGGASAEKLSSTSATGASVNGSLSFRLKYAYMDLNKPFAHSKAFGKDKLTFGQQQQPLTDWEEGLYGFRFVNLTPWNYLSLSSTYPGVKLHGPIMIHGKQYLDYEIGAFNGSSYHAYEVGDKKQVMARLSYYPSGAVSKYQGLGLTGFVDYGYKDAAPDTHTNVPVMRVAALVHYQSKSGDYGIAGEYDYGRNAFSLHNLYSGSGPADAFGLGPTPYATFNSMASALLGGTHTHQRGFDLFGHARLGNSPFYLFGMLEQFQPNTNVDKNPLDFRTIIGGISYKYGKYWQFAVDSQNIIYYQSRSTFPAAELANFSPSLAAANPNGIPNAVPGNSHSIVFNVLFNY